MYPCPYLICANIEGSGEPMLSTGARYLNNERNLYPCPYLMCANIEGSGEPMLHYGGLVGLSLLAISTKISSCYFGEKYKPQHRNATPPLDPKAIPGIQSKKEGKDQESIQTSTTPFPGYQWESDNFTIRHHKQESRGQPLPSR